MSRREDDEKDTRNPAMVGRVIAGRYRVDGLVGEGGIGVVVRARHPQTGDDVAIKLLHRHLLGRVDLGERLLEEARACAAIKHPGIVHVIDAGITEEGEPFLVMDLLSGASLRTILDRGRLGFGVVRRITLYLLSALAAAHAAGFIHRDLKPDNVFITSAGRVMLLDFGTAKVRAAASPGGLTIAGSVLGTPEYMSPEQFNDARTVDARTDVWSVGVMLYEMLTGVLPYIEDSFGELVAALVMRDAAPVDSHVPGFPLPLSRLVARALARDLSARFPSAAALAEALAETPGEDCDPAALAALVTERPGTAPPKLTTLPGTGTRRRRAGIP